MKTRMMTTGWVYDKEDFTKNVDLKMSTKPRSQNTIVRIQDRSHHTIALHFASMKKREGSLLNLSDQS